MFARLKRNLGIKGGGGSQLFKNATGRGDLINGGGTLLKDASCCVVWDEDGEVHLRTQAVDREELMAIPDAMLDSRENAMRNGVMFGGKRYEVHRYHPEENMIYGRNMDVTPDKSTGWALLWTEAGINNKRTFVFVMFAMPCVSAMIVPQVQEFIHTYIARDKKKGRR